MVSHLEARDNNEKHNQGYLLSGDYLLSAMPQQQPAHAKTRETRPAQNIVQPKVSNIF